jgi:hypothetical protein
VFVSANPAVASRFSPRSVSHIPWLRFITGDGRCLSRPSRSSFCSAWLRHHGALCRPHALKVLGQAPKAAQGAITWR